MARFTIRIGRMIKINVRPIVAVMTVGALIGPMSGWGDMALETISDKVMIEEDVMPIRGCMALGAAGAVVRIGHGPGVAGHTIGQAGVIHGHRVPIAGVVTALAFTSEMGNRDVLTMTGQAIRLPIMGEKYLGPIAVIVALVTLTAIMSGWCLMPVATAAIVQAEVAERACIPIGRVVTILAYCRIVGCRCIVTAGAIGQAVVSEPDLFPGGGQVTVTTIAPVVHGRRH